jgi:hypothetical protein
MMVNNAVDERESFVIPSRTLHGSKRDMVENIDEAIVGLLALRHLIDAGAPQPESLALGAGRRRYRRRFRWPWHFNALRPVSLGR